MSVIRWEEPPPSKGMAVHDWPRIGAQLAAAPGKWALVAVCPNGGTAGSTARHVRDGKYEPLAVLGLFEAKSRTIDGEHRVYARYVGEAGSEATPNDLSAGPGSTSPEPGPECSGCADHPRPCPAHGDHPHGGRRCLDCPECPQPMRLGDAFPELRAESTKDGTPRCTAICGREPEGEHAHDCPNRGA